MNVFPRISTSHFIVRLEEDFWNVRFQWWWDYLKKKNGVTEKAKEKKMVLPSDNSCCFSNSDLTPEDYKQRMRHWKKNNATAKLSMFCSQKKHSSYCCLTKKFCQKQKKKILYFYLLLAFPIYKEKTVSFLFVSHSNGLKTKKRHPKNLVLLSKNQTIFFILMHVLFLFYMFFLFFLQAFKHNSTNVIRNFPQKKQTL